MAIQKITESELSTEGIRALPTRPSAPSLYSGAPLSAEELKAAFDRLPSLVARRFNALLDATGLFESGKRYETLAELIATRITPEHSLAQFFHDVTNGNLALYLSVDGEQALADALSDIRRELLALSRYEACVEGEGDLVSDVTVEGDLITFHKDAHTSDILDEAHAYADAPEGEVASDCTLPVSGARVADALRTLEEKCDPAPLDARVRVLEAAAVGNLYSYPTEDTVTSFFRAGTDALPNATLLRLGGAHPVTKNILPETLLTTYEGEHLRITWDKDAACLVFDGTLTPAEGEIMLVAFPRPAGASYFSGGIFPRGGTISLPASGGKYPELIFYDTGKKSISISFEPEKSTIYSEILSPRETSFDRIVIRAEVPVTFSDYRCNIALYADDGFDPSYMPYVGRTATSSVPRTLSVLGPNEWTGEREKRGMGSVVFQTEDDRFCGDLYLSFEADSDNDSAPNCYLVTTQKDGTSARLVATGKGVRTSLRLYHPTNAYVRFEIRAAKTAEESLPYTVHVKNFQLERVEYSRDKASPYSEPLSHTLHLPESFSRFADRFYGLDGETCNYLDFERGMFIEQVKVFTLDAPLTFTADPDVPNRFSAPCTCPADFKEGALYRPSGFFNPLTDENETAECLWFTQGSVVVESGCFPTAEALNAFLALNPIDVTYAVPECKEFLTEEELAWASSLLLPVHPLSYLYLSREDGSLTEGFVRMQYQVKNTEVIA